MQRGGFLIPMFLKKLFFKRFIPGTTPECILLMEGTKELLKGFFLKKAFIDTKFKIF